MNKILYGLVFIDKKTKKSGFQIFNEYTDAFLTMKRQYEKLEPDSSFGELNDENAWLDFRYKWEILEF